MIKLDIPAEDTQLDSLNAILEEELEKCSCPMKTVMQIQLAVEEVFVNISHYAYQPGSGNAEIDITTSENPHGITICFKDRGIPFNPLLNEESDITLPAEARRIGGLGIFLVRKTMDNVTYRYIDGMNELTVYKAW